MLRAARSGTAAIGGRILRDSDAAPRGLAEAVTRCSARPAWSSRRSRRRLPRAAEEHWLAGSGIDASRHRLAPIALGKRRAQQFVQVLVTERVEIDVVRRACREAEVRIGGDDLGQLCDRGAGEDLMNR